MSDAVKGGNAPLVGILVPEGSADLLFAARRLAEFWSRSCGVEITAREGWSGEPEAGWCRAGSPANESSRNRRDDCRTRYDGFRLRAMRTPSGGTAWEIGGNDDDGVRQGLWELLRHAELERGRIALPTALAVERSPFFRERYFMPSTPLLWNRLLTPAEDRFVYQTWSAESRLSYLSMIAMMGFNTIQVSDEVGEAYAFRFRRPREDWRREAFAQLEHARKLGLSRMLFTWGASIGFPAPAGGPNVFSSRGFNPSDPEDGPVWEDHLDYVASYAPHIEEVLTHWGDPGGFEGATIEDAQRLHMRIWDRFRERNPAVRSIFSLWMLHHPHYGRWSGYRGPATIIDGGILPPEVSLAMHGRIDMEEAKRIKDSGRRCGPWVWYLADNEIHPGLHVHTGWMDEYFGSLPREAGEIVDFHGVELNCHQLDYPSVYVAARKLWDPYRSADDLLDEFCRLVFGPAIGEAVRRGYQAVARTRCRSDYGHRDVILGLRADDEKEYVGEDPRSEMEEVASAAEALEAVREDPDWISRLPLPVSREQMREDLIVHLKEIGRYARFRIQLGEVLSGRRSHHDLSDWERPDGYLLVPEAQEVQRHLRRFTEEA